MSGDTVRLMEYFYGSISDKGDFRKVNQDSYFVNYTKIKNHDILLAVICDGVGGLSEGEYASQTVISGFGEWFQNDLKVLIDDFRNDDLLAVIADEIEKIIINKNSELLLYSQDKNIKMGTTLTALIIVDSEYCTVQIGDSKCYLLSDRLHKITNDQTLVATLVKQGSLTEADAKNDKRKHIILQCIGVKEKLNVEFKTGKVTSNARFCLCSDGFTNLLEDEELQLFLEQLQVDSFNEKLKDMISLLRNRGEKDNITSILIQRCS